MHGNCASVTAVLGNVVVATTSLPPGEERRCCACVEESVLYCVSIVHLTQKVEDHHLSWWVGTKTSPEKEEHEE